MKTTHILHGGGAQHVNSENDLFFKEILKRTTKNPGILLVHFAGSAERLESNVQKDMAQFERNKGSKELVFVQADEKKFMKQIKEVGVVYLGGGTTVKLKETLVKYPGLIEAFKGKIIAGESAGANVQATYCYSKSGGGVFEGLGLLPVFVYPHYEKGVEVDLTQVPDYLEKLYLTNYQFKVFVV